MNSPISKPNNNPTISIFEILLSGSGTPPQSNSIVKKTGNVARGTLTSFQTTIKELPGAISTTVIYTLQGTVSFMNQTAHYIGRTWEDSYSSFTGVKRGVCYDPTNNTFALETCARQTADCAAHLLIPDTSCCVFSECKKLLNILPPMQPFLHLSFAAYNLNTSLLPEPSPSRNSICKNPLQEFIATGVAYLIPSLLINKAPAFTGQQLLGNSIPWGAAIGAGSSFIWGQNSTGVVKSSLFGAVTQTAIDFVTQIPLNIYNINILGKPRLKTFMEEYHRWIPFGAAAFYVLQQDPSYTPSWAPPIAGLSASYMIFYETLNPWALYAIDKASPFTSSITSFLSVPITAYAALFPVTTLCTILYSTLSKKITGEL
jgi:hypothetical protein